MKTLTALLAAAVAAIVLEGALTVALGHHTGVLPLAITLTLATLTVAATGGHLK